MTQTARHGPDQLATLLEAVSAARALVALERASGTEAACNRARMALLRALESYADALADEGATLPHKLRVELNLYRLLDRSR